jgi:hypothetical protein
MSLDGRFSRVYREGVDMDGLLDDREATIRLSQVARVVLSSGLRGSGSSDSRKEFSTNGSLNSQ